MSDFIFSTKKIDKKTITKEIQTIYDNDYPLVQEFHGEWGSAGISVNPYNGFLPYENDYFITFVVGGPLLMFRDNSFLANTDSFEGTKSIFERWNTEQIKWDEDLSGPFTVLIINKETAEISCITDLMSFIAVYNFSIYNDVYLGTHVAVLAAITDQRHKLDAVSLADFLLHGRARYRYAIYEYITQIELSSIHNLKKNSLDLQSSHYWVPKEQNKHKSIKEASVSVRNGLTNFINKITAETSNIAQFLSGGEDSRMLSGLLQGHQRDGHIFLDSINREGKIAQKVAEIYDVNLKLTTRDSMHYFNILPDCSNLVGSGSQYHHAHTYGFHQSCQLNS